MKYSIILLIAAFLSVSNADEWNPKIVFATAEIEAECKEKHIKDENFARIIELDYPNEEPVHKYVLCLVKKMGLFDEHQGYIADRWNEFFQLYKADEKAVAIIKGCLDKNEQKSNVEEWAYRGYKCIRQGIHKAYHTI